MSARLLVIAGSDSGGGAGLQADLKTACAFGVYGATAVTAITVQDTVQVHQVVPMAPSVISDQIRVVMDDIGADAVKIGMIGSLSAGEAILRALEPYGNVPIVLDPVLVATSGDRLGGDEVGTFIREEMATRATLLTPNVPELAALSEQMVEDVPSMVAAADALSARVGTAVLAKGGHLEGDRLTDALIVPGGQTRAFVHKRQPGRHTHGTGCTLSSAIASGLALGKPLEEAVRAGTDYVAAAIAAAPALGKGHGPLGHMLGRSLFSDD